MPSFNIKLETYYVYKTTNLVNNKYYIGVHKSSVKDLKKQYLGSGNLIRSAIKKYGRENFEIEILYTYNNSKEAFLKESELVTSVQVEDENCYNIKVGGLGGVGLVHREETKKSISQSLSGKKKSASFSLNLSRIHKGKKVSNETREKQSISQKNRHKLRGHPLTGYRHTDKTKFFTVLATKVTHSKSSLSKWYPEFKEYY